MYAESVAFNVVSKIVFTDLFIHVYLILIALFRIYAVKICRSIVAKNYMFWSSRLVTRPDGDSAREAREMG